MSNLIQIKVAELNQLNPLMIAEDNRVEQKFIQMYNAIWGTAQGAQKAGRGIHRPLRRAALLH